MKICITGYSGFLGKHLSNYLAKKFNIIKVNLRKLPQKDTKDFNLNFLPCCSGYTQ